MMTGQVLRRPRVRVGGVTAGARSAISSINWSTVTLIAALVLMVVVVEWQQAHPPAAPEALDRGATELAKRGYRLELETYRMLVTGWASQLNEYRQYVTVLAAALFGSVSGSVAQKRIGRRSKAR